MPAPSETLYPDNALYPGSISGTNEHTGSGILSGASSGTNAVVYVETGTGRATFRGSAASSSIEPPPEDLYPTVGYQVAFASQPLDTSPAWVELSTRARALSVTRGRSYEFERMETGTAGATLSNRDAALSPANSSSPYAPIKSTRPVRVTVQWSTAYPVFRGITEGFPQAFPSLGRDALVALNSSDFFYALNRTRFEPGSTVLGDGVVTNPPERQMEIVPAGTVEVITVGSTALPMPQAVPFDVILDEGTVAEETVTVTEIVSSVQYRVTRGTSPQEHVEGAPITTRVVSFGQALSGTRIREVLEQLGFDTSVWADLDPGQSLMVASEDLAGVSPLEHINLITEAEFGRFFVSRDGKFTFRDRHSVYLDFLTPAVTFRDLPVSGSEIPYRIEGVLEHSDDKLYNRVRISTPSGHVADVADSASIADHFERVFEKEWPYADDNDADAAARFILARSVQHSLRLPRLTVHPANSPIVLWPLVLAREIGDRVRFRYQPEAGGTEIDQEMIVEGIGHQIAPRDHTVSFQLTEADPNEYWILGVAGYSELGETTWVGF